VFSPHHFAEENKFTAAGLIRLLAEGASAPGAYLPPKSEADVVGRTSSEMVDGVTRTTELRGRVNTARRVQRCLCQQTKSLLDALTVLKPDA